MKKSNPKLRQNALRALFPGHTPTLQDVCDVIARAPTLSRTRKRDFISAIRRVATALGMPTVGMPADVKWLQGRLEGLAPASLGISRKTWTNITSNALQALREAGLAKACFARKQLDPDWQELWDRLHVTSLRAALGRFMTFCSNQGIRPDDVGDQDVQRFADAMAHASLTKKPAEAIYYLTTGWNRASENLPAWPSTRLTVPSRVVRIATPISELPPSLQQDLARYIDQMRGVDPLAEVGPERALAPATLSHRQLLIRRFFGDLVTAGVGPERISNLAAMVAPDMVRIGLRQMMRRRRVETSSSIYITACILKSIAKNYAQLDEPALAELRDICRRLKPRETGMTAKNRARLRQFDDAQTLGRLLHLPRELLEDARKESRSAYRDALLVEVGLAIELLLSTALRIKNLASLHIDENIQSSRAARSGMLHLIVEPAEVKNGQALEFELNEETVAFIRTFVERHRSQLVPHSSRWLFGRRDGSGPIDPVVLARRIKAVIRDRIGVTVNAHLFRALTGKLFLDTHPGGYEVVRRVLGHKCMTTTTRAYTGLEGIAAGKHFDKTIRSLREELPVRHRRRRAK